MIVFIGYGLKTGLGFHLEPHFFIAIPKKEKAVETAFVQN